MDVKISPRWKELLGAEFEKPYFAELVRFVKQEYATRRVFPAGRNIFHAFDMCDPDDIKVVVIGQDPYHGEGQAHGLCFSVNDGVPFPPSLVNIFQEVRDDTGAAVPASGNLDRWASQGVLLLNAVLTVRAHEPASHAGRGWEQFTDAVVRAIAAHRDRVVYMLWGSYAQRKGERRFRRKRGDYLPHRPDCGINGDDRMYGRNGDRCNRPGNFPCRDGGKIIVACNKPQS